MNTNYKMKHRLLFWMALSLAIGCCSCGESGDSAFDASLLYGKWQEGSVFERYLETPIDYVLSTGDTVQVNGLTWDESEDVGEEEAQAFNWTLTGSNLQHIHVGTFVNVPKIYTVTTLTSSLLCYEDAYGTKHEYSKAY